MSESVSSIPEQRTPSDMVWVALSGIEDVIHARGQRNPTPHLPSERIRVSYFNMHNHEVFNDLDYIKGSGGFYWPRLVSYIPDIHYQEIFEQVDDEKVLWSPDGQRDAVANKDPLVQFVDQLDTMHHMLLAPRRDVEWRIIPRIG